MANEASKIIKKLDVDQVTRTKSILNANQIQAIYNSTPDRYKYTRPAKGGGEWTYASVGYVRQQLDKIFGYAWSFDIETTVSEAFEVAKTTKSCLVKGTITALILVNGQWLEIKKTQFGRSDVKFRKNSLVPLDFGNDFKSAASDCLKKCASLFGIASDIYEAKEFEEIEITESDDNSSKEKRTKKLAAKLAKEVHVEEVND